MKNRKGFTLIEIIVVMLIIGVLTAISLPNLFNNVIKERAHEGLATINSFRPTIEGCIVKAAGVLDGTTCNSATLGNPLSSANFSYALVGPSSDGDTGYTIIAGGTGALTATDVLTVSRAASSWPGFGAVSCTGGGKLIGVC